MRMSISLKTRTPSDAAMRRRRDPPTRLNLDEKKEIG
jgi:hypothetical protein